MTTPHVGAVPGPEFGGRFADRTDAGARLAPLVASSVGRDAVALGVPRGGVVVAAVVAERLGLPLGVVVVRKLGAPGHEEYAVGAIADGVRVLDAESVRALRISESELGAVEARERIELARRAARYTRGASRDLHDREVVIVDDGIATGSTAIAACEVVRARGASRIVLATPVAPASWRPPVAAVDEYLCLVPARDFWAVGQFYERFEQTTDAEVERLLGASPQE